MITDRAISLGAELARATDIITAIDLICDAMVDKLAKLMMVPVSDGKWLLHIASSTSSNGTDCPLFKLILESL